MPLSSISLSKPESGFKSFVSVHPLVRSKTSKRSENDDTDDISEGRDTQCEDSTYEFSSRWSYSYYIEKSDDSIIPLSSISETERSIRDQLDRFIKKCNMDDSKYQQIPDSEEEAITKFERGVFTLLSKNQEVLATRDTVVYVELNHMSEEEIVKIKKTYSGVSSWLRDIYLNHG